ncbi:MAG: bacteriocin family protein [Deferribacteraceae bacterium]|nr:bacteriocin family protein [Deferribacteraceae bacterium]
MDYLGREGAPISADLWRNIDNTVVDVAKKSLKVRRFLPLVSVGTEAQYAKIERFDKGEEIEEWFVKTTNRQLVEIPQIYSDFWLNWRDLNGAIDLSPCMRAATVLSKHEDEMIFYGIPALKLEGLLTVKGSQQVKRGNWGEGENAFADVATGIAMLEKAGRSGRYALVVSPDLYMQLQRIQAGTGVLESKRIQKLVGSDIIKSTALKDKTAFLVCAESYCMDLAVGQDITTAYLECVDLNHHFRVMETALLRIKCPDAIVLFT